MISWTVYLLFIIGLIAVIKGADWAVDSAVWLSKSFGIPEVIVGATIVSIGTTLPETMISALGAYRGSSDVVVGTFLGSILFNTGTILGIGCLIHPIKIRTKDSFLKIGSMIGVLILFGLLSVDGTIRGFDTFILLALLVCYLVMNIYVSNNNKNKNQKHTYDKKQLVHEIIQFVVGITAVVLGAKVLLDSGEQIAHAFGISEAIIATTMYAAGSSLPELVTSLTAAYKGHSGLMLGNVVGANTLNVILVAGVSSLISPLSIGSQILSAQIPTALLIMAVLFMPAFFNKKITRIQGLLAFLIYLIFIINFALA